MDLSVITVCYNSEKTIKRCIDSVLMIKGVDYEYIIIDEASTDKTVDIANSYIDLFHRKRVPFNIVSERDNGIYDAMNKGIELAKGEWVLYINSDDALFDDTGLSKMVNDKRTRQYGIVYGDTEVINKSNSFLQKPKALSRLYSGVEMPFCHQSTITKRKLLEKYRFDESYMIIADLEMYLRMYEAKEAFKYMPICISSFSNEGLSQTNRISSVIEGKKMLKAHGKYSLGK